MMKYLLQENVDRCNRNVDDQGEAEEDEHSPSILLILSVSSR